MFKHKTKPSEALYRFETNLEKALNRNHQEAFQNGYNAGYLTGYRDGAKEERNQHQKDLETP